MIEFTERELTEFFRMAKKENLRTHLIRTIETTRKVEISSLIKLVDQQVLNLELFTKIKTVVETPQTKFIIC
jgi:hypothetical protein